MLTPREVESDAPRIHALTLLVAAGLLLVGFSGCLGPDDPEDGSPDGRTLRWEEGMWWSYDVVGKLPPSWMEEWFYSAMRGSTMEHLPEVHEVNETVNLIATNYPGRDSKSPPTWIAPDDPEIGFLSRFGFMLVNDWYLSGTVRGTDGDGTLAWKGNRASAMLKWPLEEGKEWTTRAYGQELTIKVLEEHGGSFELEGRIQQASDQQETVIRYGYDPDVRWLSHFHVLDEGQVVFKADLVDHGKNYEGKYYMLVYHEGSACYTNEYAGSLPVFANALGCYGMEIEAIDGGLDRFWYNLAYKSTGPGTLVMTHENPEATALEVWHSDICPCDEKLEGVTYGLEPGRHGWDFDVTFFSEDLWKIFWLIYECYDVHQMHGGETEIVKECDVPW